MGKVDTVMKNYLQDKTRFADLFNGVFFGGRQVILPQELSEASESYVDSAKRTGWFLCILSACIMGRKSGTVPSV